MQKKQTIIVVASLLVVVLSVTLAYFTAQIIGKGKDVSVSSADLKIIFTDTDGKIEGINITPGWSNSKTFTVKNESNRTYKYDIIIKDLVNTFVTEGYIQYKITSTNGGYNMTDYVSVPKSSTATDTILAKNVSIAVNATQTYTIEFRYVNDENVDQSDDMGKKLSGTLFITEGTKDPNQTLLTQLLEDNPTVSERKDFTSPFTTNTTNTLYKAKEDNTDVYYFAGIDGNLAHCEVEDKYIDVNDKLVKFTGEYNVNLEGLEDVDEDTCKTKSLCNLISKGKVVFGLTQAQCQELAKKHELFGIYDESNYSEDLTNRTWVTEQNKPINNWVKFGKYQKDLIRYRGYSSSTSTYYEEYSTMDECTSASSYNINCTEYKYANTGDDIYWRIIRTNSDGSIRLLYHGTSTTATDAHIGKYVFNSTYKDPMYVGYMYGTSGSLVNNRTNTNNSTIKTTIDNWYAKNMTSYTKYLSTTAVYCNDRSLGTGQTYSASSEFDYAAHTRLETNKTPTYDCEVAEDKFTVDTSTGNGKLTYPIALMTADEVSFAGGVCFKYAKAWPWYNNNSVNGSSTDSTYWWLLSPSDWNVSNAVVFDVNGSLSPDALGSTFVYDTGGGVRPVLSLKSCIKYSTGDGTAETPYEIVETDTGC